MATPEDGAAGVVSGSAIDSDGAATTAGGAGWWRRSGSRAGRWLRLGVLTGGVMVLAFATIAVANVLNPDLVDLPPVMRRPFAAEP